VRDVVDLMAREGGVTLAALAVDGGAAANDLLCQIQADQVHIPVDRSAELQTTGLGAAFLAGLGTGVWSTESDLVSTRRSDQVFTPQSDGEAAHRRWRRAVERAKGWLAED
jgi:glycerol kinase